MIRNLMASSAVIALISAGMLTVAQAEDNPAKPAVVQEDTTAAEAATTDIAESDAALTPDRPTLVSVFFGRSVYSSEDPESDNIGDINDLIVSEDGAITHAVVGVGGFLGIGEKDVAVPFDELKLVEKDGDIRLIYAATKEQLEAAPALDRTAYNRLEHPADQEAASAEEAQPDTEPAPADEQIATAETEETAEPAKPAEEEVATAEAKPAMAAEASFITLDQDQTRATTIIGKSVYGPDDASIGEVSDLVLQEDGETRVALMDVGGFLGVGEKTVGIPFEEIQVARSQDPNAELKLTVAMTKDQLEQLPEVKTEAAAVEEPVNTSKAPSQDQQQASTEETAAQPADEVPETTGSVGNNAADYQPVTNDVAASDLMGATVYGPDDEQIGEIGDVIFDPKGGIKAVEIDVGGFLGIGEKPVGVSFDALNVRTDEDGTLLVMVNATKEQLEEAPAYYEAAAQ